MEISPYGQKAGLKTRMQEWATVLRDNRAYVGLIADIEQAVAVLPDDPPGSVPPPMRAKNAPAPTPTPAPAIVFDL